MYRKLNLLSFGEEAEEEEKGLAAVKEKIKSSHDVLNDPRLLKGEPTDQKQDLSEQEQTKQIQKSVREALVSHKTNPQSEDVESLDSHDQSDDDEMKFDERMCLQILRKQRELGAGTETAKRRVGIRQTRDLSPEVSRVLARLEKFKGSFLSSKPVATDGASGSDEDDDVSGWQSNLLKFQPDLSNKVMPL
ncbi:Peptidyl-prolyl cis-trans isomerase [Nymphaea thermarum]|nr:Peptidyl-prolyl cis-trans isomerase [Nymphaea thermarum]